MNETVIKIKQLQRDQDENTGRFYLRATIKRDGKWLAAETTIREQDDIDGAIREIALLIGHGLRAFTSAPQPS